MGMKLGLVTLLVLIGLMVECNAQSGIDLPLSQVLATVDTFNNVLRKVKSLSSFEEKFRDAFAKIEGISPESLIQIRKSLKKIFSHDVDIFQSIISPMMRGDGDAIENTVTVLQDLFQKPFEGIKDITEVLMSSSADTYSAYENLSPVLQDLSFTTVRLGKEIFHEIAG